MAGCIGATATLRDLRGTLAPRDLGGIAGGWIDVEGDQDTSGKIDAAYVGRQKHKKGHKKGC